jgi:hypothetical protein
VRQRGLKRVFLNFQNRVCEADFAVDFPSINLDCCKLRPEVQ